MTAYIGLGSNLGERDKNITRAIKSLSERPGVRVRGTSAVLETLPLGVEEQPLFLNAVVKVETTLSPRELLDAMLEIERALGRVRAERWGPRIIDLDLLLYGDQQVKEPGLTVPHPEIRHRPFVMAGLDELGATQLYER